MPGNVRSPVSARVLTAATVPGPGGRYGVRRTRDTVVGDDGLVRLRALAPLLFLPFLLALPARADDPPPVSGLWRMTFKPTSVRSVGQPIPRGDVQCEDACAASYQFGEDGLSPNEGTLF